MPSPVRLSVVCCLSVTLVRPTPPVEIFGNISTPLGHPLTSMQNFTEIVSGEPLRRKRVTKYSDFEPIEGYLSETVQDRRQISIDH